MSRKVSIVICTRNRCDDLQLTLESLRRIHVPERVRPELVVIDNGSKDRTAEVVNGFRWEGIPVRHCVETQAGHSHARNRGLAEAAGEFVVFTDDDIRFPESWLERMTAPLLDGVAQAVAGGVRLAPQLNRPWMTATHRAWLASTEYLDPGQPQQMVGANMAFAKAVLEKVPGFDVELGAGRLGCGEESLFSWQLKLAGYTIHPALDVAVEHVFESSRLTYASWLKASEIYGRTRAYHIHHWFHEEIRWPWARVLWNRGRLALRRLAEGGGQRDGEGCPEWELHRRGYAALYRSYIQERRRPRNYTRQGLVKLGAR